MSLRTEQFFFTGQPDVFKKQLVTWAQQYETVVFLDSNNYEEKYSHFDAILAVEEFTSIKTDYTDAFEQLKEYQSYTKDYLFGYLSYDLKNDSEQLSSNNFDGLGFPDLFFFQPQKIILLRGNEVVFTYLKMVDDEIQKDFENITRSKYLTELNHQREELKIKLRVHKNEYHSKVSKIIEHIKRGDIYEANFCQEFYVENTKINPLETYTHLNHISKPPFATFLKKDHLYLMSASPERYLKKEKNKIISQPIKGTAKRFEDPIADDKSALNLAQDEKERAENIMIVDLVRNDLSRTAKKASVKVEELCSVYTFEQVHQLVSTVVSESKEGVHPVEVIRDTFPMGSMTGAPKVSAMKIIENSEATKRGLYSGSVGYFYPNGDFDFNVVIRSILYNEENKYISFSVGSAITAKSNPDKEYEECLTKAKAMKYVLTNS